MIPSGTILAGYRVDTLLAEGSVGVVYLATELARSRTVAFKVLNPEFSHDPDFRERFRREGRAQASMDHPHIAAVLEAGETEHGLFLAMRLVNGPTLKDMIAEGGLEPRRALSLLAQVAQALDAAHDQGLVHRDIKPQNILVDHHDHAYLVDFGLTKTQDGEALTQTGQFLGTIDYVSPEQAQGETATGRSDTYALAAVTYECLTGEVPFPRASAAAVLYAHLADPPPRVSECRPGLPAALDEVIARGMAKDPSRRPASASELLAEAERALDGLG